MRYVDFRNETWRLYEKANGPSLDSPSRKRKAARAHLIIIAEYKRCVEKGIEPTAEGLARVAKKTMGFSAACLLPILIQVAMFILEQMSKRKTLFGTAGHLAELQHFIEEGDLELAA